MLVKTWRKENPYALFVEMQINMTTMENSTEVPQTTTTTTKKKSKAALQMSNLIKKYTNSHVCFSSLAVKIWNQWKGSLMDE